MFTTILSFLANLNLRRVFTVLQIVAFVGLIILLAVYQYKNTELKKDNKNLQKTVQEQSEVIRQMNDDLQSIQEINNKLINRQRNTTDTERKNRDRLKDFDISKMSDAEIKVKVSEIFNQRLRCIEIASGKEKTNNDKNNVICPHL